MNNDMKKLQQQDPKLAAFVKEVSDLTTHARKAAHEFFGSLEHEKHADFLVSLTVGATQLMKQAAADSSIDRPRLMELASEMGVGLAKVCGARIRVNAWPAPAPRGGRA